MPYPINDMKHLGDITKISGYTAPTVDVIIGGSPCQDLSVAGKRAGLKGKRSGLFTEQIRIIKEMREASAKNGATEIRPRYMVWENVPGAFSSNGGEDFRAVLEETVRLIDENAVIPRPAGGKWRTCGCIMGDGFSVAWRVLDAQFWGVPQRRRRIALVADFGGERAPEILFERESVSGSASSGGETRKRIAADIEADVRNAVFDISQRRDGIRVYKDISPNISALAGTGGNNVPLCFGVDTYNQCETGDKAKSLVGHSDTDGLPVVCYSIDRAAFNQGENAKYEPSITDDGISQTLVSRGPGAVCYGVPLNFRPENMRPQEEIAPTICNGTAPGTHNGVIKNYKVRRFTPLECERLQGYPDGWTDIGEWTDSKGKTRDSSDGARYKALGNSIALPPWRWVLKRISACYGRPATMASLFDGIGGFPLIWKEINGKGSCLWTSEIEEFPIAVTKRHFNE